MSELLASGVFISGGRSVYLTVSMLCFVIEMTLFDKQLQEIAPSPYYTSLENNNSPDRDVSLQ